MDTSRLVPLCTDLSARLTRYAKHTSDLELRRTLVTMSAQLLIAVMDYYDKPPRLRNIHWKRDLETLHAEGLRAWQAYDRWNTEQTSKQESEAA